MVTVSKGFHPVLAIMFQIFNLFKQLLQSTSSLVEAKTTDQAIVISKILKKYPNILKAD